MTLISLVIDAGGTKPATLFRMHKYDVGGLTTMLHALLDKSTNIESCRSADHMSPYYSIYRFDGMIARDCIELLQSAINNGGEKHKEYDDMAILFRYNDIDNIGTAFTMLTDLLSACNKFPLATVLAKRDRNSIDIMHVQIRMNDGRHGTVSYSQIDYRSVQDALSSMPRPFGNESTIVEKILTRPTNEIYTNTGSLYGHVFINGVHNVDKHPDDREDCFRQIVQDLIIDTPNIICTWIEEKSQKGD